MYVRFLFMTFFLTVSTSQFCYSCTVLQEKQIEEACSLNRNQEKFEDYLAEKNNSRDKDWLTLEENYSFKYKESDLEFCVANGFCKAENWGEIALYPKNTELGKIGYSYGSFNDFAAPFLSYLKYEYVPAEGNQSAYFIVEKVATSTGKGRKGYSQACLKYFLEQFVNSRTDIKYVFSDLRNPACQHFFPKYGFESGIPAEFQNEKFKRPFQKPYSWKK